jgi:hypothetical protein
MGVMPKTPPRREKETGRLLKSGDYRAAIWGNTINFHHKSDMAKPVESTTLSEKIPEPVVKAGAAEAVKVIAKRNA